MRRILIAFAVVCLSAFAQNNGQVTISERPSFEATETRFYRDGSSNMEYSCIALGTQPEPSIWTRSLATSSQPGTPSTVGTATLTSIVDATNTSTITTSAAHGLSVGQWVTISGATVDSDLNGEYVIASVGSSTTFTVTTANVTDATYNEATLLVRTRAPRTNANVWAIQKFYYTSTAIDRTVWAKGTTTMTFACDTRTSLF